MSDQFWTAVIKDFPWAALITAVSTITAVCVTSYLTGRRSARERLWELQREAFGEILCSISEGARMIARLGDLTEAAKTNPKLVAQVETLTREWMTVGKAGRLRAIRDGLILPREFNEAYERMSKALTALDDKTAPHTEQSRAALSILRKSQEELEGLAREHLKRGI